MSQKYFEHNFPVGIQPARYWLIEIKDNDSDLILYNPDSLQPLKRKKQPGRKDRVTEIKVSFRTDVIIRKVKLSLDSKSILFFGSPSVFLCDTVINPAEIEINNYYERDKKRKILNAFYFQNESPPANIHWVLARYEQFYAIDTNTENYMNVGMVSVTTVLIGKWQQATTDYSMGECRLLYVDIAENVKGNPEFYALHKLMLRVQEELPPSYAGKIGFIVDSELDKIKDLNYRRLPLYDDFYIPIGFELIHATDASGSQEYYPNKMIRECENNSKRVLTSIECQNKFKKAART